MTFVLYIECITHVENNEWKQYMGTWYETWKWNVLSCLHLWPISVFHFSLNKLGKNYLQSSYNYSNAWLFFFDAFIPTLLFSVYNLILNEDVKHSVYSADHGCVTISQYILLDPILMFWIMLSTYCFTKFQNCKNV